MTSNALCPDRLARVAVNEALATMRTGCSVGDDGVITYGPGRPLEDAETVILAWVTSDLIVEALVDHSGRIGLQVIKGLAEALGVDDPERRYDDLRREVHGRLHSMLSDREKLRRRYRPALQLAQEDFRKKMRDLGKTPRGRTT